ncbi:outer membrane protein assembly factor BamB family protein [Nonomuraea sp. NPDC002799]
MTGVDGGAWPAPLGNGANTRTSRVPLSGKAQVRWRVTLPHRHVTGISVAASGRCFVTSDRGIVALDGPALRWTVDTAAPRGCLLLGADLLVAAETGGLVVRDQRTGSIVSEIDATPLSDPAPLANGLLVFLASRQGESVLRATTLTGQVRWEVQSPALSYPPLVLHDQVIVTEGTVVRAFDQDGGPAWSAGRHEFRTAPGVVDQPQEPGAVDGPLVGLPSGNVLVPIRADDVMGYLVVDPRQGDVQAVPAHLRPGAPVVPLRDPSTGRELLVLPGWPETDEYGESRPTVTVVDISSGTVVLHHRVPSAVHNMVAGVTGLVAVAGSPSWDRWSQYHGWPGFDLRDDCYVLFLDQDGIRAEWKPGEPITGPLAVGADGEILVPLSGDLVSLA